jgi:hypothetical protein
LFGRGPLTHSVRLCGCCALGQQGSKLVEGIVKKAAEKNVKLHFPVDFVVADSFSPDANSKVADAADGIPDGWMGLDAGPKTRDAMKEVVMRAKTIVWNGPVGMLHGSSSAAERPRCHARPAPPVLLTPLLHLFSCFSRRLRVPQV